VEQKHLCKAILKSRRALIAAAVDASQAPMPITSLEEPSATLSQLAAMSSQTCTRARASTRGGRQNEKKKKKKLERMNLK
jgi:hypothetical protein